MISSDAAAGDPDAHLHGVQGFLLRPKFVFIDGRSRYDVFREFSGRSALQRPAKHPAFSYFELMDRLVPNFLSTLSSQEGPRRGSCWK